jgi:hypothetical protein
MTQQAMTAQVVVGILLVQVIWNLTAATCLLRGATLAPITDPAPGGHAAHMKPAR